MCARLIRTLQNLSESHSEQLRAFTPDQLVDYISHPPGASVFSLSLRVRCPTSKNNLAARAGPKAQKRSSENRRYDLPYVDRYAYTGHSISPRLAASTFFHPFMYLRRPLLALYHRRSPCARLSPFIALSWRPSRRSASASRCGRHPQSTAHR